MNAAITEESTGASATAPDRPSPPAKKDPRRGLRPAWKPGQSGNPAGRPAIERKVRREARKFDKRMLAVLVAIAENPNESASERRKAAMDVIAVGNGRPELVQSVAGKDGQPLLGVNFNMASAPGQVWDPATAYRLMVNGTLDADANHPAFADRPALEVTETAALPPAGDEVSE